MKEENNRLKGIPMEHNIFNQLNELAVELNVEGL